MAGDNFRYDLMIEQALLGVVSKALTQAAKDGLTAGHHFYITFRTGYPGVSIPDYLRKKYPEDITIVLEHKFWDLLVTEEGFSVTLSFQKVPESWRFRLGPCCHLLIRRSISFCSSTAPIMSRSRIWLWTTHPSPPGSKDGGCRGAKENRRSHHPGCFPQEVTARLSNGPITGAVAVLSVPSADWRLASTDNEFGR